MAALHRHIAASWLWCTKFDSLESHRRNNRTCGVGSARRSKAELGKELGKKQTGRNHTQWTKTYPALQDLPPFPVCFFWIGDGARKARAPWDMLRGHVTTAPPWDMLRELHGTGCEVSMRHVVRAPWDMLRGLHGTCPPWDMLRGLHGTGCEGSIGHFTTLS